MKDKVSELEPNTIEIYSDGASSPNPGRGGYGYIIRYLLSDEGCDPRENIIEGSAGYRSTTNQRMEMMGALNAINYLGNMIFACKLSGDKKVDVFRHVKIISDSSYLCSGFTKGWVNMWKVRYWLKSNGKPVLNRDLWEEIDSGVTSLKRKFGLDTRFIHVQGHKGWVFNEACDKLAVQARQSKDLMIDSIYETMYR